jgi:hypothetical protein
MEATGANDEGTRESSTAREGWNYRLRRVKLQLVVIGVIHIGAGMDKVQFTAQGTATYPCGPVGWQYLNK